ncbi:IS4 family transposase [Serratia fonticola]|uniref:IS4 family transposase n=1 Tax=Serratia fonticola TaxID=47917 RepID=UPI0015C6954A|nr:IS4 family transposase [Serratia fonticola]MBC3379568.1 IS4 family transposase [Serratia fonticola]NYA38768.1 IS4 family transposase [Serratia fonticola]
MVLSDCYSWANGIFGLAQLGDCRRTQRLVSLTASLAKKSGLSIVKSSQSTAEVEGAYRLIRNPNVSPEAIAEAGFNSTAKAAQSYPLLLALEDTTSINFSHTTAHDEFGNTTTSKNTHGLLAHSVLLYAPDTAHFLGLIDQQRWTRKANEYGKKHQRKQTPYEEKESYKWQQASERAAQRLGLTQSRVISVFDREADIWHYLDYKTKNKQRFVVRAAQTRLLSGQDKKLMELPETLIEAGHYLLNVVQKGGRAARDAQMSIRYSPVDLKMPGSTSEERAIPLTYICCREEGCWHLLTSEKVTSAEEARVIISYYERRWLIEEYHKAWKSGGTQVEQLRMQTRDNLERMIVILSFIAVRVLALRQGGLSEETGNESCERILSPLEWKLLWVKQEGKALPKKAPNVKWAYLALAKMGRWYDSKRTGRAGWIVMWEGWSTLQDIVEGYKLAKSLDQEI